MATPEGLEPHELGFIRAESVDLPLADQAQAYLNVFHYDEVKYSFYEKHGAKLCDIALGLARHGHRETYVWDGVMKADEQRARYEVELTKKLDGMPPDLRAEWMEEFQADLNNVESLWRALTSK